MLNQTKKYFIYSRKSTESEERQILSIDSQIKELQELAVRRGFRIVKIFRESQSAKEPGRPVFAKMMEGIANGDASGILCWKLDRLARNSVDAGAIIWALKDKGIEINTPTQSYSHADENSILMYLEFGMSQKYIDDLSKNVKRGLKTKVGQGWMPAFAPIGYINTRLADRGVNTIVPDPERFPLVRQAWDFMLTGLYTPQQIVDKLNKELGYRSRPTKNCPSRPLGDTTIYRTFNNPFYFGMFRYNDQLCEGHHEPMVSKAEFDRVQVLLHKRENPRPIKYSFTYGGLIRCACGLSITAEKRVKHQQNGNTHEYTYYHCTKSKVPRCAEQSISEEELEAEIDRVVSELEISPKFRDWAFSKLQKMNEQESAGRRELLARQRKAYDECLKKIDGLIEMRAAKEIGAEQFKSRNDALLAEKGRLNEALNGTDELVSDWVKKAEAAFDFATLARKRFVKASPEKRREFVAAMSEPSNLILNNKTLDFIKSSPLFVIKKAVKGHKEVKPTFEPLFNTADKRKGHPLGVANSRWLGRWDSNPRPIGYTYP